jgi:hypothetical protein
MKAPAALLTALLVACGGKVDTGADASDGGDAGLDVAQGDGGWTMCEAPSGIGVCGGPNDCGAQCTFCGSVVDASELRACSDVPDFDPDAGKAWDGYVCPDGALNACSGDNGAPDCWDNHCVGDDLPKLYLLNGRPDLARYADRSTYTGDPLPPPPTSCPAVSSGLELCGGACGPCQDGTKTCTGRSPLHPYSLCVESEPVSFPCSRGSVGYCNQVRAGFMCLTFKVDDAAQTMADTFSLCVDGTTCQAAAQSYPGGAFCTPGSSF